MSRTFERRTAASCRIALALTVLAATRPAAQEPLARYRHRLLGVFDAASGSPIAGAGVMDLRTGTIALTTSTGTVDLAFVADGGTTLRVRKLGYHPVEQLVPISPTDTTPVTLLLVSSATVLPPLLARDSARRYRGATLNDFEARRATGRGQFIGEDALRKRDAATMPDVVRGFSGLQVLCSRTGFYTCEAGANRMPRKPTALGGECRFAVFIDGVNVRDPDLTKLVVADFAGIEAYTAGQRIPPRFNMNGNPCGALLFWSRER